MEGDAQDTNSIQIQSFAVVMVFIIIRLTSKATDARWLNCGWFCGCGAERAFGALTCSAYLDLNRSEFRMIANPTNMERCVAYVDIP